MIRVESITIKEFRGIRDLKLDFNGQNFAVCGLNGTGKSGVVDALEFALTGNVSRLSGQGTGGISLREHGPHVDSRNAPERARVTLKVTIPSLGKTVTVERDAKSPAVAKVTPKDTAVLAVLRKVEEHPELVLSRRELIRYVIASPGKRAEEVQALLRLDRVEQVRQGLQKIANACEKQLGPLETAATQTSENLLRALGIPKLTKQGLLAAANDQRAILGLPALAELTEATSLKDGLATLGSVQSQRIPKNQALADIRATLGVLAEVSGATTVAQVARAKADLTTLAEDPVVAAGVTRENFYSTGMGLIETGVCPFCDSTWDLGELKKHVQAKIDHLKEVSLKRKAAEAKIEQLTAVLGRARSGIEGLVRYAALATPALTMQAARDYLALSAATVEKLAKLLPLEDAITALDVVPSVPSSVLDTIGELDRTVSALPEPTKQDSAREWLTVCHERLEVRRDAIRKLETAKDQAVVARQVSDVYVATSDACLEGIYKIVENGFSDLYRFINRADEDRFVAKLVPSLGKLGFDVDFYGRGFFPPGAYHSEGHQDGMGVCLYLALMRHLQGSSFTFAVLDDVLMSVDTDHRREVCLLLKQEFPNTQFIMTTHDPIWLKHLKTEGLIAPRMAVHFRTWTVDHGPVQWDDRDVWTEIEDYVKQSDVRAGAALLRHYLEYVSRELCHRLRARVEFRGDAQYQLGELLPAAIAGFKVLLHSGKNTANTWGQREIMEQLVSREATLNGLVDDSRAEQWQVNAAIHFNTWDNLAPRDFTPVVKAFQDLLNGFTCQDCGEFLRVTPERETRELLRCDCGRTSINLVGRKT